MFPEEHVEDGTMSVTAHTHENTGRKGRNKKRWSCTQHYMAKIALANVFKEIQTLH